MAIEDYLQYNGQKVSTLNAVTYSALRHDQLDIFFANEILMFKCFETNAARVAILIAWFLCNVYPYLHIKVP